MKQPTSERMYTNYNTVALRYDIADDATKLIIFKSLKRVLESWLPKDREDAILDIGCGYGALLCYLKNSGYTNLAGFDISPENVEVCHRMGLDFVHQFDVFRLQELPTQNRYDVIFMMDVVEHLPKEKAADVLEEVRDRLNPDGYVIIQTPNLGSILGPFIRHGDLTHEFGLTEKSAVDLLMLAGFGAEEIKVRPSWNATTLLGLAREIYLRVLHHLVFLADGAGRPRIPTKNLLIRAVRS